MSGWPRALTPRGWGIVLALAVIGLTVLASATGWRWDPFDLQKRRLEAATARLETVEAALAVQQRLSVAEAAQATRLQSHHQVVLDVTRITAAATVEARTAHDADQPLDPARVARLSAHDEQLCRAAPDLCLTNATEPARSGVEALRPEPAVG